MDPLSDVLRAVRLTGAHFFPVTASGTWTVESVHATELAPRILPHSEHLISYHLVLTGRCWGGVIGQPLLALEAGDVILFPHGDAHIMSCSPESGAQPMPIRAVPRFPDGVTFGDPGSPGVTLVCGFFGCDRDPFNPLCSSLPSQLRVSDLSEGIVGIFARQVVEEASAGRAGTDSMLTRLAELMFIEVLRRYLGSLPDDGGGWLAGVRDPLVGKALTHLHSRPEHRWSLVELAEAVAASRSVLAERFTTMIGLPPMQYLAQWRMQIAAGQLRESGAKVATVAEAVGYESEAAFSRAFKKATGVSPGRWRVREGSADRCGTGGRH